MKSKELIAAMDDIDTAFANGFGKVETLLGMAAALRAVIELCVKNENDIDVGGFAEGILETIEKGLYKWEN